MYVLQDRNNIYADIVDVIGTEAADKLCAEWGGKSKYTPAFATADHPLTQIIGFEAAKALCDYYRVGRTGARIELPMRKSSKAAAIRAMLEEGKSAGEVATELNVHQRTVFRHRAKMQAERGRALGKRRAGGRE